MEYQLTINATGPPLRTVGSRIYTDFVQAREYALKRKLVTGLIRSATCEVDRFDVASVLGFELDCGVGEGRGCREN